MSPHASSDIVILITYLHNGINTPHYLAATSLLHCIPDTLWIFPPLDNFFAQTSRQASISFYGRDIAKGGRTRFYIRLFLGRKSVFLQLLRTLSLKRLMLRILNNFSDAQQFIDKFCSQQTSNITECVYCASQCILISARSGLDSWSKVIKYWY